MSKKAGIIRTVIVIVALIALIALIWVMLGTGKKPAELPYDGSGDSFVTMLENGEIQAVYVVNGSDAYILKKNSATDYETFKKNPAKAADYHVETGGYTAILQLFDDLRGQEGAVVPELTLHYETGVNWTSIVFPVIMLLLLGGTIFFIIKQNAGANKQAMNFGKTKARMTMSTNVKFSDVAGAEEEKEELKEIVDFLKNPQKFSDLGARIPKGVLLVGPPGTGKTLFAKAVAGESNVPFFSISGSDFVEMFVGTGAARVRDLFDQAKRNMPCIVFIDEIDAVGRQRGAGLGGGHDEREQTLNQLLVQMDGFEKNEGIIIMAATNRADILDPALLRPGRFDRQIYVNIPDVKGREEIFKVHSRNKPLAPDVSFKILARMTSGFSGADIANLLNEAAILAARAGRKVIVMEDILEGINKVIAGPQKKSRVITDSDKRITAYHEAGHAIIARLLPGCDEVQEVSIIPRGMAAGYTLTRPDSDDSHVTKNKLLDNIVMMLGGRAAEQIVIHDISTGASNDIERASGIARKMVTEWGMSEQLGNMFLGGNKEVFLGRDYGTTHSYSEKLGGVIDSEVKRILDESYDRALTLIKEHRSVMDNMVRVLFAKNTIYTDEVEMLFDGKSAEEVIKAIDERQAKHQTYRYDYEPKREAQEAKIINASEFVESENAKDKAVKAEESKAEKTDTAEEKEESLTEEISAENPVEEKSADEKPAAKKPAAARKPRKAPVKKDDKPEGGDDKAE
ncbi:MAG TPA: ATP-dependent zinc metalloprotease FtsH [Candidatus Ornithoclostridium faecavium]|nr:ATP-dependent zinc metalloprotease FtsH [Candidatus Ornithoclostridium faecavium]